jgi:hypothetical protein
MVVVHGLDDFFQIRSPGAAPDWWQVCVYVFHAAYGWWLPRHYGGGDVAAPRGAGHADDDERPEEAGALD